MAFKGIAVLYPCRNAMTPEERNFIKITPADQEAMQLLKDMSVVQKLTQSANSF